MKYSTNRENLSRASFDGSIVRREQRHSILTFNLVFIYLDLMVASTSSVFNAALLFGAPNAVTMVDDILRVPVPLDLQQSRVVVSKVPASSGFPILRVWLARMLPRILTCPETACLWLLWLRMWESC